MAMLTNYDSAHADFNPAIVRRLVTSPDRRAAVVRQTAAIVQQYSLAGVTLDFENIPDALTPQLVVFLRELERGP